MSALAFQQQSVLKEEAHQGDLRANAKEPRNYQWCPQSPFPRTLTQASPSCKDSPNWLLLASASLLQYHFCHLFQEKHHTTLNTPPDSSVSPQIAPNYLVLSNSACVAFLQGENQVSQEALFG